MHTLIAFRLRIDLAEALSEAARKNDRSVSAEIRQAIRAHLEADGKQEEAA